MRRAMKLVAAACAALVSTTFLVTATNTKHAAYLSPPNAPRHVAERTQHLQGDDGYPHQASGLQEKVALQGRYVDVGKLIPIYRTLPPLSDAPTQPPTVWEQTLNDGIVRNAVNAQPNHHSLISAQIIGGSESPRNFATHCAAIFCQKVQFCGGSLVSVRYVLTAAHCTQGLTTFEVYLGSLNISIANEAGRMVISNATKLVHSKYNNVTFVNDISLLRLNVDAKTSAYIEIIRLPKLSDTKTTFDGVVATVAGWGATYNGGPVNNVLKYVNLTVISNAACAKVYGEKSIVNSTICCATVASKAATCIGDSGSGLVVYEADNIKTIVGIVSFGSGRGCDYGDPVALTRVTSYLQLIANTTGIPPRK